MTLCLQLSVTCVWSGQSTPAAPATQPLLVYSGWSRRPTSQSGADATSAVSVSIEKDALVGPFEMRVMTSPTDICRTFMAFSPFIKGPQSTENRFKHIMKITAIKVCHNLVTSSYCSCFYPAYLVPVVLLGRE